MMLRGQYVEISQEKLQQALDHMIIPAHCTGWRAVNALGNIFGDKVVVPSAVGRIYRF